MQQQPSRTLSYRSELTRHARANPLARINPRLSELLQASMNAIDAFPDPVPEDSAHEFEACHATMTALFDNVVGVYAKERIRRRAPRLPARCNLNSPVGDPLPPGLAYSRRCWELRYQLEQAVKVRKDENFRMCINRMEMPQELNQYLHHVYSVLSAGCHFSNEYTVSERTLKAFEETIQYNLRLRMEQ